MAVAAMAAPAQGALLATGALLLFELLPAPRPLYSATVPRIYRTLPLRLVTCACWSFRAACAMAPERRQLHRAHAVLSDRARQAAHRGISVARVAAAARGHPPRPDGRCADLAQRRTSARRLAQAVARRGGAVIRRARQGRVRGRSTGHGRRPRCGRSPSRRSGCSASTRTRCSSCSAPAPPARPPSCLTGRARSALSSSRPHALLLASSS